MSSATPTPADTAKAVKALRKRLERWELEHLRQLAASLAEHLEAAEHRMEALQAQVDSAYRDAEAWREDAMRLVEELEAAGGAVGITQTGALVVCDPAQPPRNTGDAWRYCSNLDSPEAGRALVQAVLTASGTIHFALTQIGGVESFATVPDWMAVQGELLHALQVAGHPAGRV